MINHTTVFDFSLDIIDGKYFFEEQLFSGTSYPSFYPEDKTGKERILHIRNGVIVEERDVSHLTITDYDELEHENGFTTMDGIPFTGLALKEHGEFCAGEIHYDNGISTQQKEWNEDGSIKSISNMTKNNMSVMIELNSNQNYHYISFAQRDAFKVIARFTETGKLKYLQINGDIKDLDSVIEEYRIPSQFHLETITNNIELNETLSFQGDTLHDYLLHLIEKNRAEINKIDIDVDNLNSKMLIKVLRKIKVKELVVANNKQPLEEIIESIAKNRGISISTR